MLPCCLMLPTLQVHAAAAGAASLQSAKQAFPFEATAAAAPENCAVSIRTNTNWGVATASYQVWCSQGTIHPLTTFC